jgi:hypothetical protein
MPLTPQNRWVTFLLSIAILALGIAFGVLVAHEGDGGLSDAEQRVIQSCLTLSAIVGGFAGQAVMARTTARKLAVETAQKAEDVAAKTRVDIRHDVRNELGPMNAHLQEVPKKLVQELNGGLKQAAQQALDECPFPTTHAQLAAFVRSVRNEECELLLERAYPRMLQAAREAGWQPPQNSATEG